MWDKLDLLVKQTYIKSIAAWFALKSGRLSLPAYMVGIITVCYALSPIDLVPDFIPIVGVLDELIIIPALLYVMTLLTKRNIIEEYLQSALDFVATGQKIKLKLGAILVILTWVSILILFWNY